MPLMPVKINSPASINFAIPIVSSLVFSMHNGKLVGPVDGFGSVDWDYIRTIAVKRAIAMRSQGFVHPATLVPSELEYAEGYRARMSVLWNKMRPIPPSNATKQFQKPNHQQQKTNHPQQKQNHPQQHKPNQSKPNQPKPQHPKPTQQQHKPASPKPAQTKEPPKSKPAEKPKTEKPTKQ